MLQRLYIRNFALIEELEVEFDTGLNIVTGETGAGKSIIVGALKLILGDRASTDVVRQAGAKAVVEGMFDAASFPGLSELLRSHDIDEQPVLILRREVSAVQSRAFINDSPATVSVLREVASQLVDLHGQHDHQSLLRTDTHLDLVDGFGGLEGLVRSCEHEYAVTREIVQRREETASRERELRQEKEFLAFQLEEIDDVAPLDGEEEELEAERRILENAERLFEATSVLFELLYNSESAISDLLVRARNELQDLTRIDDTFDSISEEISSAQISVSEAAAFLQDYNSRIEFNPQRLTEIRERLIDFDRLKRKYGGTIAAVLALREDINDRYALATDFEGALFRLDEEFNAARSKLADVAFRLSSKRKAVAGRIESAIVSELANLGMPKSTFKIDLRSTEDADGWIDQGGLRYAVGPKGLDKGAFHISTNPGVEPLPLAKVASGGEVSRIMLALKSILAKSDRLPILIFDEIDTGISGAIAQRVGDCMVELGSYHQIIAITHLPQVAAAGDAHFRVEKESDGKATRTSMIRLSESARREEIASLLSGENITEASLRSARELIESRPRTGTTGL
ncbi:MAG: DNA repair protein RecN [Bacteroidetes Order II. Incertae sedis bacterium]|nr:DNA repair protein RecN [Bacteroidetes Order II. bacterium]MBT4603122.1 DNA repair protein RecN [Bacteroidetes Order II. bacterium]MBT5249725.1 DNA repair protein RecN [Bacteroidetes Order II. bacterium]MBT6200332.1 DNA repair protein RecN [Bacteroidetes Order II. bacterium]MBT6424907.1 DNA repair protein RecN [Bacteroidetes Order II. bacterium]